MSPSSFMRLQTPDMDPSAAWFDHDAPTLGVADIFAGVQHTAVL